MIREIQTSVCIYLRVWTHLIDGIVWWNDILRQTVTNGVLSIDLLLKICSLVGKKNEINNWWTYFFRFSQIALINSYWSSFLTYFKRKWKKKLIWNNIWLIRLNLNLLQRIKNKENVYVIKRMAFIDNSPKEWDIFSWSSINLL